jgi:diguanylate cyclase (GGDEF)-like protein
MNTSDDAGLRSILGRRLLAMLALAALLPLLVVSVVAGSALWSALRDARDAELAQHAREFAEAAHDRLLHSAQALRGALPELAGPLPLARTGVARLVGDGNALFAGIARLAVDARPIEQLGNLPGLEQRLAALDAAAQATLADGHAALLPPQAAGQPPLLVLAGGAGAAAVAAALAPGFLWDAPAHATTTTAYCVLAGSTPLFCPAAVPAELPLADAAGGRKQGFRWRVDGTEHSAGAALRPLDGAVAGERWTVFAVQRTALATAPLQTAALVVLMVALASLAAVFFAAARQVRQIGAPLRELLRGTQRLAQRDFSTQVAVRGDDEFGRLASAFNTMAGRLALQFGTLQAMAKIDRAILNSVDLSDVALNSIRCLRHIVDTDLISVGLIHPESAHRLLVQTRRRGAQGIEKLELLWPESAAIGDGQAPSLPPEYEKHLKQQQARTLRVLPISRGGSFWGVVVLGDTPDHHIDPDRASMLSGVVDRLAVALSTAARDWRLHVQAHYDPLTGLPNRAHLLTLLTQHIAMARRDGQRGAVLFIDLDRFKQTNDTLGHAAGDELLRLAAERIRLSLRESDTVARIGGDEFTVVLPRIAATRDAGQVAGNLIAALNKPFEIEGQKLYAGGSVGIALFPDDGDTAEELLKRADTAMYRAKELGRGRHAFFQASMGVEMTARAALDRELRQALERREFVLYYQPQVDLATGRITGAEALLRWQHPSRGLLGPSEFIDFAEESGLIEQIGAWVLRSACDQHRLWETMGLDVPCVSVNVSNRQLRQPGFLTAIDLALVRAQREPAHLEIEITESLLMDGGDSAMRVLNGLKQAGVNVAIDDFGTGYSSFAYLRTLPATVLKLDRSFVIDIATDADAAVIAASMIQMARTLRKTVVVEGVETQAQLALLAGYGAHRVQGYLVSRPLPAAQFEQFVRDYEIERAACTRPGAAPVDTVLPAPASAAA